MFIVRLKCQGSVFFSIHSPYGLGLASLTALLAV
jgi:hypothetical protein